MGFGTGASPAVAFVVAGPGNEEGQVSKPEGVVVDQADGVVYVADTENRRVDEFSEGGVFIRAFGWGVRDGSGELQVCTSACRVGLEGPGAGEMLPRSLGVDGAGDVFVSDEQQFRVQEFDAAGAFVLMFGREVDKTKVKEKEEGKLVSEAEEDLCTAASEDTCGGGVAGSGPGQFNLSGKQNLPVVVDGSGDVWVGDLNRLEEFSPAGVSIGEVALPGVGEVEALAVVEGLPGGFYVKSSEVAGVQRFEASGAPFGAPYPLDASGNPRAIALDASGNLYVSDQAEVEVNLSATLLEYDAGGVQVAAFGANQVIGHPEGNALAFAQASKKLYTASNASDERSALQAFVVPGPGPFVEAESTRATAITKTAATLGAAVNPEGAPSTYHFQYVDDADFKAQGGFASPATISTPESEPVGEPGGFTDQPAAFTVAAGGLAPSTVYHFRAVARNENGEETGEEATFETLPAARIDSTSATEVTSQSAVLVAQINPLGQPTTYHFEYLTQSAFEEHGFTGATRVPVPDGSAGSGLADETVSQLIENLQAQTVYRYRVMTSNGLGEDTGIEGSFTTQGNPTGGLPDGREWEMVSPAEKHGALIEPISEGIGSNGTVIQAAPNGQSITYVADAPTESNPQGYTNLQQVLSVRGPNGWTSKDLALPHVHATGVSIGNGYEYRMFSEDLSQAIVQPFGPFIACGESATPCLSEQATEQTAFLRNTNTANYTPLVTRANDTSEPFQPFGQESNVGNVADEHCPPLLFCGPDFVAATPDLGHVVLFSRVALTSTPTPNSGLYEWGAGQLSLISLLPTSEGGGPSTDGAALGDGSGSQNARNAVSLDGSRVVWHTGSESGALYVRDVPRGETVRLDVLQPGGTGRGEEAEAVFQDASTDDSRVFFTDTQHLTATSGGKEVPSFADLYECLLVSRAGGELACELSDLTPRNASRENAAVQGVLGVSEDGSYVYFVADGVLENGGVPVAGAQSGAPNLYVRHDGVTRLVAVLSGEDEPDWKLPALEEVTSRVSPDGEWVAFMSDRSLTKYDNHDTLSGVPDEEVYLYDAASGRLVCASCDPSGGQPGGAYVDAVSPGPLIDPEGVWKREPGVGRWLAGSVPGWTPFRLSVARYQSRYLSDNGRLFFDGHDGLVPGAVGGSWMVYEWEPVGVGGCGAGVTGFEAGVGGCVGLVSSGVDGEESAFLDASATGGRDAEGHEGGGDVFFLTTAKLVSGDLDTNYDVYDAHECSSGVPCFGVGVEQPSVCVTEGSCKAAVTPQPSIFGAPASATFTGIGNPVAPTPVKKVVVLTRAQKLAVALKVCRKKTNRRKRDVCEAQARKRYGPAKSAKKAKKAERAGKASTAERASSAGMVGVGVGVGVLGVLGVLGGWRVG